MKLTPQQLEDLAIKAFADGCPIPKAEVIGWVTLNGGIFRNAPTIVPVAPVTYHSPLGNRWWEMARESVRR